MSVFKIKFLAHFILALLCLGISSVSAQFFNPGHVTAELISASDQIKPGLPARLALRLRHDSHWHTYWVNPGDSGMVTQLKLDLPATIKQSSFYWPTPKVFEQSGLINYVYENEVLLVFDLTLPEDYPVGSLLTLEGKATWLECDDSMCVPGQADVSLPLKVVHSNPSSNQWTEAIQTTLSNLPSARPQDFTANAYRNGARRLITLEPATPNNTLPRLDSIRFFSSDAQVITEKNQSIKPYGESGLVIDLAYDDVAEIDGPHLSGLLVSTDGWGTIDGQTITALAINPKLSDEPFSLTHSIAEARNAPLEKSLIAVLGLAFLGGLILNLMPCVFPVLGIKILGFVQQSGESKAKVMMHGLIFTLGVLIGFWLLSGALIILRQSGQELGWGFQLQSAHFVLGLSILVMIFALSLSGVFEFGLGAVGAGSTLTNKSGLSGTFFSGLFATVMATPCAAPLLGTALGAAVALPPLASVIVFTVIGLGLSFPYLLLSAFPQLAQLLPRPGAWMDTFKQLMAFPLYATVGFLLWVVSASVESDDRFLNIILGLVVISLACWLYGRCVTLSASAHRKRGGIVLTALCAGLGLFLCYYSPKKLEWEVWSPQRVEQLIENKAPFYIDFTALWCLTCKLNKTRVFGSEDVLSAMKKHDVTLLKADWTKQDETITQALAAYGRSAIPFNLIYGPNFEAPQPLPELLSPEIVLEQLHLAIE